MVNKDAAINPLCATVYESVRTFWAHEAVHQGMVYLDLDKSVIDESRARIFILYSS